MPSVNVDHLPKNILKLTITVPAEEIFPYIEEAAIRISEKSSIPGFRPGKAGYDIIKQRFGEMKILEEALEPIIRKTYTEAILSHRLETVGSPHIEVEKMVPGNDLVYTAEVPRMPNIIRLADYRKVKVSSSKTDVGDKEVDQTLEDLRRMQTREIRAEAGTAASGTDKVVLAVNMKKNRVPIEGGQSPNHTIYLSEDYYVPGMKEKISGMKEGERKSFTLAFPTDHVSKLLAGQDVDFEVTINEIYHLEAPVLDDHFAISLGQKDIISLKRAIRENLEKEKKQEEEQRHERELLEKIAIESRFEDVPDLLVNEEINKMIRELQHAIEEKGAGFEEYLKNIKKTLADLKIDFTPQAILRIKVALVLKAVADAENVEVDQKEIDDELDKLASRYESKETKAQIFSPTYREYAKTMLRNRKTIQLLTASA